MVIIKVKMIENIELCQRWRKLESHGTQREEAIWRAQLSKGIYFVILNDASCSKKKECMGKFFKV